MKNRFCELLDIKYPIIQGAMGAIALPELVSAVAEAGGLGVLATAGWSTERIQKEVQRTKELTDKPFAVNLALVQDNIDEIIDVLIEEGIRIVTTGAGTPKKYMPKLQENNFIVIPVVASAKQAAKMEALGADAVICEGTEAGGHIGQITTMVLGRSVVKAVEKIPVGIAGGISDGATMAAAFALGAEAVQLGTAFVATKEAPISDAYKQAVIDAKATELIEVGRSVGAPMRLSTNCGGYQKLVELEKETDPNSAEERAAFEKTNLKLLGVGVKGDIENGSVTLGQAADGITEILTVKEVIENMFNEAVEVVAKLEITN